MDEDIQFYLDHAKELMEKSIEHTKLELQKLRAGKAMPNMLDDLRVEYYGAMTPVGQVASINTPDARTIVVKPWEKSIIADIERAIINSDLGLNPQNDGEQIRINIPPLSEERRKILVKHAKNEAEKGKISIRNARKDANDHLKQLQKDGVSEDLIKKAEDIIQTYTNDFSDKVDEILAHKETEIMTV
jgi:ribosome recycling factor